MRRIAPLLLALLIGGGAGAARGQAPVAGGASAWHMVRPGDTLEDLAARFLGTATRWEEIARINPELADPNTIRPGHRLRIPLAGDLPARSALIEKTSRRVEEQLAPHPWQTANELDLLRPRDALRTFDASSAELRFADDTRLVVTEQSLVFIDRDARATRTANTEIEVVVGQADLAAVRSGGSGSIDVVLGDALASPRAAPGAPLAARLRRPEAGGAQLMMYKGESELEAGGGKVKVETGMGSAVAGDGPPSPPEPLLPAPTPASPAPGSLWPLASPLALAFSAVSGAASYTVEVCLDAGCGRLVARRTGLAEPRAVLAVEVGTGERFWRATAVAPSGLDGYPSEAVGFRVEAVDDAEPPLATIAFEGPSAWVEDHWVLGPGARLSLAASDAGIGIARVELGLDGQRVDEGDWSSNWADGARRATALVTDRVGNRREVSFEFVADSSPPVFSWGVEGSGERGALADDPDAGATIEARQRPAGDPRLLWPEAPGPRNCPGQDPLCDRRWTILSDRAQVLVRPRRDARLADGTELGEARGLWVLAVDGPCRGARDLRLQIDEGGRLLLEASDCVGNRRRTALTLPAP